MRYVKMMTEEVYGFKSKVAEQSSLKREVHNKEPNKLQLRTTEWVYVKRTHR